MTAATLLAELAHRGATIEADGEDLVLSPVDALDDALLLEARQLKPELLRLLAAPARSSTRVVCGCARPRLHLTGSTSPAGWRYCAQRATGGPW
jgi:hypothetical protein